MRLGNRKLEDWGIVTRFVIGDPPIRKKLYVVPGRNGSIDASEALTGYTILDDREINIELFIKHTTAEEYQAIYDDIYKSCHGEVLKFILDFDEDYYYEGRWSVSKKQENLCSGMIVISASCFPYALKKNLTVVDVSSTTGEERQITLTNAGMPTRLEIYSDADITIVRGDRTDVYNGHNIILEPLLIKDETITVSGIANASITYQEGKK